MKQNLPGGLSAVVPPDPMPNSEVKRRSADGSVGSPHARVGNCQSITASAVEVVILKMLHMFEIPFLLVGTFKYISSAFNPRLSATLFLIGFNLSKQLSGVVLSAWVGRMYDTVGFHQAYLILGCITLSFTLLSFVTLRGGNRLLPTAETQSPA